MKIQYRILIGYLFVIAIGFIFLIKWTIDDVKKQAAKTMEESLIDISQVLASTVEEFTINSKPDVEVTEKIMNLSMSKHFVAQVYKLLKTEIGIRVYITDKSGIVIYDSKRKNLGDDFSTKNDVYLTLRGKYGARTTRINVKDPMSSYYYVGAPIKKNGEIIGVLTVSKPARNLNVFIINAKKKIIIYGLFAFLITLIFSYLISLWIVLPMKKLVFYTMNLDEPIAVKNLGGGEVEDLGNAILEMQNKLEGKEYVENYIQTLTHEIKSPLSTLIGATEILKEKLNVEDRLKFVNNVEFESKRILTLIEKMLGIASLERRNKIDNKVEINLVDLVKEVIGNLEPNLNLNQINIVLKNSSKKWVVLGDKILLYQVIENLISNAIDFSDPKSDIEIQITKQREKIEIEISDEGTGIPDFALPKVFDKFYSLKRPKTGKKSTGLGLSIVKEIVELHGGVITLNNNFKGGLTVKIEFSEILHSKHIVAKVLDR